MSNTTTTDKNKSTEDRDKSVAKLKTLIYSELVPQQTEPPSRSKSMQKRSSSHDEALSHRSGRSKSKKTPSRRSESSRRNKESKSNNSSSNTIDMAVAATAIKVATKNGSVGKSSNASRGRSISSTKESRGVLNERKLSSMQTKRPSRRISLAEAALAAALNQSTASSPPEVFESSLASSCVGTESITSLASSISSGSQPLNTEHKNPLSNSSLGKHLRAKKETEVAAMTDPQSRLAHMQYIVESLLAKTQKLDSEKKTLEGENRELRETNTILNTRIDMLQEQDKENQSLVANLRNMNRDLRVKVADSEKKFEKMKEEEEEKQNDVILTLQESNRDLRNENMELHTKVTDQDKEIGDLKVQLQTAHPIVDVARNVAQDNKENPAHIADELRDENQSLKHQMDILEQTKEDKEEGYEREITNLKWENENLKGKNDMLRVMLEKHNSRGLYMSTTGDEVGLDSSHKSSGSSYSDVNSNYSDLNNSHRLSLASSTHSQNSVVYDSSLGRARLAKSITSEEDFPYQQKKERRPTISIDYTMGAKKNVVSTEDNCDESIDEDLKFVEKTYAATPGAVAPNLNDSFVVFDGYRAKRISFIDKKDDDPFGNGGDDSNDLDESERSDYDDKVNNNDTDTNNRMASKVPRRPSTGNRRASIVKAFERRRSSVSFENNPFRRPSMASPRPSMGDGSGTIDRRRSSLSVDRRYSYVGPCHEEEEEEESIDDEIYDKPTSLSTPNNIRGDAMIIKDKKSCGSTASTDDESGSTGAAYLVGSDPVLGFMAAKKKKERGSFEEGNSGLLDGAHEDEIDSYIERRFSIGKNDINSTSGDQSLVSSGTGKKLGRSSRFIKRSGSSMTGELNSSLRKIMNKSMTRQASVKGFHRRVTVGPVDGPVSFGLGKKKTNRYAVTLVPTVLGTMNELSSDAEESMNELSSDAEKAKIETVKNEKVLKILNKMSLMLTKNTISRALIEHGCLSNKRVPFQLFFLLSKNFHIAKQQIKSPSNLLHDGTWFLDPFVFKYADCMDKYLCQGGGNSAPDPAELSAFCCPDGIKVRLIPSAGIMGAKHMGWKGKLAAQYKLLVFTDGNGASTNGVAITIYEEIPTESHEMKDFMKNLRELRAKRAAARIVCRWWKKCMESHKKTKVRRGSSFSLAFSSLFHSDSESSLSCFSEEHRISNEARKLGKESFQAMKESDTMGDTLIVERCYVMVGGDQSEQFLHLRLLQNMIQMEQEEITKQTTKRRDLETKGVAKGFTKMLKMVGLESEDNTQKRVLDFRHDYLRVLETKMMLSPDQARLQKQQITPGKQPPTTSIFEIDVPGVSSSTTSKITVPLPLPDVAGHWGVAALLLRIDASELLQVIMLLLIERSVLIIGESSHLVTSCACALLELLKPYDWPSNFMPLLPGDMLDFVNSPVPFLIGMAVEDREHSLAIEEDPRVVEAMAEGLSVINLATNSVVLTTETDIVTMLQCCPTPKPQLAMFQKRLKMLQTNSPSLKSFSRFIDRGLEPQEVFTISAVRGVICGFLKGLSDNVATDDGWRHYGVRSEDGLAFDFFPSLFVDRQREYLKLIECRLQFQEMMAYSQLFVEFVDVQRKASLAKEMMGKIISNWIYQRWKVRKAINRRDSLVNLKNQS